MGGWWRHIWVLYKQQRMGVRTRKSKVLVAAVWLSCSVSRNEWSKWPLCLTTLLISRRFILLTAAWHTCISRNWRPPILISRLILNNFIEWLLAQLGESHCTCLVSVKLSSLVLSLFWFAFVFTLCFVRLRNYKLTGSSAHGWFFIMKDVITVCPWTLCTCYVT